MPRDASFDSYFAVIRLRIREARQAAGLTQEEAAARANLAPRVWQRHEGRASDISNPGLKTLVQIAQGLDLDFEDLLRHPTADELGTIRELEFETDSDSR